MFRGGMPKREMGNREKERLWKPYRTTAPFRSSEELLRDGIAPQQVMSNLIIGKTLQESTEMAEQLRSAATGVGQKLNVEV